MNTKNVLCEWIFPSDWEMGRIYDWLHSSERNQMKDMHWNRITYWSEIEGESDCIIWPIIQFSTINPYLL